jgi:PAS domain S-box-containing protein
MATQKYSVATLVIIALVTATTLLLGALGLSYYVYDRNRQLAMLRNELVVNADQLATGLAAPVWNYDDLLMDMIIESSFMNNNIYGVVAHATGKIHVRLRDAQWRTAVGDREFPADGLLVEEREITKAAKSIGTIKVFASPKFIEAGLRKTLILLTSIIFFVDLILILSLYLLIRHIILKPLRAVERYAVAVSSNCGAVMTIEGAGFHGELESLRTSIKKMVGLLDARYVELQKSEERLRLSTELANVAVWEYSFITNSMSRSNNHDRLYGLEWQPKWDINTFLNATHPDDRGYSNEIIQQSVSSGGPDQYTFDFRVVQPDLSIHWLMVVGQVVERNSEGQGTIVRGCLMDITGRKQAEEELRESESRYRRLHESMTDCFGQTTMSGEIVDVNRSYLEMLGYNEDEVRALRYSDVTPARWHEFEEKIIVEQVLPRGYSDVYEKEYIRKDGTVLPVELKTYLLRDDDGKPSGMWAIVRDITERRRAEEALRESEEKFATIFKAAPGSMILSSLPDGKTLEVNDNFSLITGYSREEALGKTTRDLNMWVDHSERDRFLSMLQTNGIVRDFEVDLNHKSGAIRNGLVSGHILTIQGKKYLIGTFYDITERKKAEGELQKYRDHLEDLVKERTIELEEAQEALVSIVEDLNEKSAQLAQAMEQAQSADRLKSAFLATMSHELRTPLNSIIGFTGIVLQGMSGTLNDEQAKQLAMVKGSANHLLDLINDVLDISKIEAGQVQITRKPFDVRSVIEAALRTVLPLAAKKGLSLDSAIAADVGVIISDRRRVEQILINLVNNAVKFTEQGTVRGAARRVRGEELHGDFVEISVADTGIGMKPEDMGKLFIPFSQIDTGLTRSYEGTGLGLSICGKLVEMLGGTIRVESEWGKGSKFTFTLPLS